MQLSVGMAIRDRRKALGWSQAELGQKAGGLNKETVNRAELGSNVTVDTLLRLTRALGVELELALRDAEGHAHTLRDTRHPVTGSVIPAPDAGPAHQEGAGVPFQSFPASAYHVVLYALIGGLSEEAARALRRPLMDLIDRAEGSGEENPAPPPAQRKRPR